MHKTINFIIFTISSVIPIISTYFQQQSERYSNMYLLKSWDIFLADLRNHPLPILLTPTNIAVVLFAILFSLFSNYKRNLAVSISTTFLGRNFSKKYILNSKVNLLVVSSLYLAGSLLHMFNTVEFQRPVLQDNKVITHAMGEIDGHYYTNSLEAFEHSYHQRGSRIFEVDFELTKEGILVARHDWRFVYAEQLEQTPETLVDNEPWTYEYFMQQKINKKYTPLDINGIIDLLKKYPDIYIVTDTKLSDIDSIKKQFSQIVEAADYDPSILERIIPQIYFQEMLTTINAIYKFENVIYTLYKSPDSNEEVLQFVKENIKQIKGVANHTTRIDKGFVDGLHNLNVYVYTHPIWSMEEAQHFYQLGVDGFYTATLSEKELQALDVLY